MDSTTFFVFETLDGGHTWLFRGTTQSPGTDRDRALRGFLGDPVREVVGRYVAVRENQWTPRDVDIKPKTALAEATMPTLPLPEDLNTLEAELERTAH